MRDPGATFWDCLNYQDMSHSTLVSWLNFVGVLIGKVEKLWKTGKEGAM